MKQGRVLYEGIIRTVFEKEGKIFTDTGTMVKENDVHWLPPFEANTIFALGLNYADHAKELSFKPPSEPLVFLKGKNTLIGHLQETIRPKDVTFMHYECELAVVIGRRGEGIAEKDAYEYVKGYTIANDYAFRDYLENYYRPNFRVKNRDGSTPIGPWLVDHGDIPDPMQLTLRTFINGNLVQEGSTSNMIFSIPQIITYLSEFLTLQPGDVILTGTPKGAVDTKVGDEVVTEIEGIGRLVNRVVAENR
ncbi:fumarylacetoacetate hydrolase family protein [Fervidibacillus halotolerans]|uniref:Fumarylacetoacetate hydrolase family protein n=1 Tax=Fervidibacillus halotolerans TaxID=2980027 RepID=A0A9E8RY44_9BACI|nr:fumarylacetoacetate hydrolase family protein [Fervidibacillus halotolerans]WAA13425.1 fumarylacetoacetate hydrolase family protein [Fervidibacillus halotolerans]